MTALAHRSIQDSGDTELDFSLMEKKSSILIACVKLCSCKNNIHDMVQPTHAVLCLQCLPGCPEAESQLIYG